jgi:hypothetical protein
MFNRKPKTPPTPEDAALRTLGSAAIRAGIKLPGLYQGAMPRKIERRLEELAAGGGTAEIPTAQRSKGKTAVIVRDGKGGLKLTEVKKAERAYQFVEAFTAYIALVQQRSVGSG